MPTVIPATTAQLLRRPASGPNAAVKQRIAEAVLAAGDQVLDISHRIHAAPELAREETRAAAWISEVVSSQGFTLHDAGRLSTAILATLDGRRGAGRRVAILAEYDALPGLGHGCAHNAIAASALGAAIGLASVADAFGGTVLFLGTPAEESYSGKTTMIDDGLFRDVDAVLMYHPSDRTDLAFACLALEDVHVTFFGREAHASTSPEDGRSALDAMTLLLVSIGLWRQRLRAGDQVHGIVTEGGQAPNITPALTKGEFMIRSARDDGLVRLEEGFRSLVSAAALASDCECSVEFSGRTLTMNNNRPLSDQFGQNLAAYGIVPDPSSGRAAMSSDIGNVSKIAPTIHPLVAICPYSTPGHSAAFREAAVSSRADEVVLVVATVLAQTAFDLLTHSPLAAATASAFAASTL